MKREPRNKEKQKRKQKQKQKQKQEEEEEEEKYKRRPCCNQQPICWKVATLLVGIG